MSEERTRVLLPESLACPRCEQPGRPFNFCGDVGFTHSDDGQDERCDFNGPVASTKEPGSERPVTRSVALREDGLWRGTCLDCGHLTPLFTSKYDALGAVEHHECDRNRIPDTTPGGDR